MTTRREVDALLTEAESLWLAALEARRVAAAKEREYRAALRAWVEAWPEAEPAEKGEKTG